MLDHVTLDRLRVFVAVADHGGFSAAGKHLGRVQSAVSQSVQVLEANLGVALFDRKARKPALTSEGRRLLDRARDLLHGAESLYNEALALSDEAEPEVSVVADSLLPNEALIATCTGFESRYPHATLRVHVESLGAVAAALEAGFHLGVAGKAHVGPDRYVCLPLTRVRMLPVASSRHVLATGKRITVEHLEAQRQIVLTDRSTLTQGRDFGVMSTLTWRVADLATKRDLIRAGMGWGFLPAHTVWSDVQKGDLAIVHGLPTEQREDHVELFAVHKKDSALGPAAAWFLERLGEESRKVDARCRVRRGKNARSKRG